jgi:rare lipoprotein A
MFKIIKIGFFLVAVFIIMNFSPRLASAALVDDCAGVVFSGNFKKGAIGQAVKCLQMILNLDPKTRVAEAGDGSLGKETSQFGELTRAAVIRFQEKYAAEILKPADLKKGNGTVGKFTRGKLNQILADALGNKKLEIAQTLEGKASYYADFFQGRKTASDEIFDKNKYTAASKTLPFGTKARVINRRNGRSVVVKINDRGPYVDDGRIIDLSWIAARDIGLLSVGLANVKVHVLK